MVPCTVEANQTQRRKLGEDLCCCSAELVGVHGPVPARLQLAGTHARRILRAERLYPTFCVPRRAVRTSLLLFCSNIVCARPSTPPPTRPPAPGMLFGVMFWSVYADKHGRRWAFVLTQACIFVAGLASSLAPSFSLLLLSRVAVGFGVGGSLPVTSALVAEFLPTKDRAKILCYISGAFWGFGLMCASLLGLLLYRIFGSG